MKSHPTSTALQFQNQFMSWLFIHYCVFLPKDNQTVNNLFQNWLLSVDSGEQNYISSYFLDECFMAQFRPF